MKIRIILLLIVAALNAQGINSPGSIATNESLLTNLFNRPIVIDSLLLSVQTLPNNTEIYVNYVKVAETPAFSEMIYFQHHFRLDLKQEGYAPYRFGINEPFGDYWINCKMVPEFQRTEMKNEINELLFDKYRVNTLAVSLSATIGAAVFERNTEREWDSYNYLLSRGFKPNQDKIHFNSKMSKGLVYTLPILAAIPILTNYTKDWSPSQKDEKSYHYKSLENSLRKRNAVYNFSLCFFSSTVLQSMVKTSRPRENSKDWDKDFQDVQLHETAEFTSDLLLAFGVIELINYGLLVMNKPKITDYIDIKLM